MLTLASVTQPVDQVAVKFRGDMVCHASDCNVMCCCILGAEPHCKEQPDVLQEYRVSTGLRLSCAEQMVSNKANSVSEGHRSEAVKFNDTLDTIDLNK